MKKLFYAILYSSLVIVILLLCLAVSVNIFYSDTIEKSVVQNINSKLNSEIRVANVDFSLWKHFPFASVKFDSLLVYDNNKSNTDTLVYAKKAFIDLNLFDIVAKKYNIKQFYLKEGLININYDENDNPNYLFVNSDTNSIMPLINEIILMNTQIKYTRIIKKTDINWDIKEARINLNNPYLDITTRFRSQKLIIGKTDYINNKSCSFYGKLKFLKDTLLIHESNLLIETVLTQINGSITEGNILDLNISSEKQQLNAIIMHMPERFKRKYAFVADAFVNCNGKIKGSIDKNNNPHFRMDFNLEKGNFRLKKIPFLLKHVQLKGSIDNSKDPNLKNTIITVKDFSANTENGILNGSFTVKNLTNYYLDAQINSIWDLSEFNHYFQESPFLNLTGEMTANTNYKGKLAFDKRFRDYFINSMHTTKTSFTNVSFNYLESPLKFKIPFANFNIKENSIEINESLFDISRSKLSFIGSVDNVIKYMFKKDEKIYINGTLSSSDMVFDELITINDIGEEKTKNSLPKWVSINLNTNISKFAYNDFNMFDFRGKINYGKQKLEGYEWKGNGLGGNLKASFTLTEPTNSYLVLKGGLDLYRINIRDAFKSFNNFNQTFIKQNDLNGIGTAELDIESHWKPGFIIDNKRLEIQSHLIIEEGELIDFKPLENLSSFVSLDDLRHVKFSKLENTIEIKDEVVTIPAMKINSSALSVFLSGTHTFTQEVDYSIKLLLSELLSNKFRKKNTNVSNEFGEINEDGEVFTTVYLKMKGHVDEAKISFDGLRLKEDLQNNIATEIETIETIIKEDILQKEGGEKEEDGQDIIMEWEEEKYKPQ